MPTQNGLPVNFGYTSTLGIAITGISGTLLQSVEQSKAADKESARSPQGDIVSNNWYDIHDEATLEWVVSDTAHISAAVAATTLAGLAPGVIMVISACPSRPDMVATNWEVQSGARIIVGGNTDAAKISVPIQKRAGITAVMPA
jgi:hypothetical protein